MSSISKLSLITHKRVRIIHHHQVTKGGSEGSVDITAWLSTVDYPTDVGVVDLNVVSGTLDILESAGVVKKPDSGARFKPEYFVNVNIARLA